MTPDQVGALVRYRMEQAHETLREAQILLDAAGWRGAVNRGYYAMFYALLALLATRAMGTSKHTGAIALFDREFVKPGIFPSDLSRALHAAFQSRQDHDYGEILDVDQQGAQDLISDAGRFVAAIEGHLRSQGLLPAAGDAPAS